MIVVCGDLAHQRAADGLAVRAARRAARDGAAVELVGIVPDSTDGDGLLLELAGDGVRHAATLRGPARSLEAADLELALRYLPEIRVVLSVGLTAELAAVAARAASWSGAAPVIVETAGSAPDATEASAGGEAAAEGEGEADPAAPGSADLPADAIVLRAPARDPDGTFAGFVGAFAARLDAGATPADAWTATTAALAVDAV